MSAPASKIKVQGGKTLYFLAKILYTNHRGKGKKCLILLREVFNLALCLGAHQSQGLTPSRIMLTTIYLEGKCQKRP
jgi:hypothetical protein